MFISLSKNICLKKAEILKKILMSKTPKPGGRQGRPAPGRPAAGRPAPARQVGRPTAICLTGAGNIRIESDFATLWRSIDTDFMRANDRSLEAQPDVLGGDTDKP